MESPPIIAITTEEGTRIKKGGICKIVDDKDTQEPFEYLELPGDKLFFETQPNDDNIPTFPLGSWTK
ncbi:hypothetical protein KBD45_00960 [Candidatus Dojkabacteria bacterium]|nr:hypothetical protein [Candidatus Dojkabacteria bacterium]